MFLGSVHENCICHKQTTTSKAWIHFSISKIMECEAQGKPFQSLRVCVCYVFVPYHLWSKFDKKAICYIFVWYDNERKGCRCCDPTTGHCYTLRNVVFDEVSSWWSSQEVKLPDYKEMEEMLEQWLREHSRVDEKELSHEEESHKESIDWEWDKDTTSNK